MRIRTYFPVVGGLFFLFFSLFPRLSWGQTTILSLQSGPWTDPSTWSINAVPTLEDTVLIGIGHHIELPETSENITVGRLFVSDSGAIYLNRANFTVLNTAIIRGDLIDTVRAGVNTFIGEARVERDGRWITPLSDEDKLIFEGGFTNKGDTLHIKDMYFRSNDQELGGSNQIRFTGNLLIGSGVTLNMTVSQGLYFSEGRPNGVDSSSTLINTRFLYFSGRKAPMETGIADFGQEGTRVYYQGDVNQTIKGTSYATLRMEIGPDKEGGNRTLDGPLHVKEYLLVDNKNVLRPGPYDVSVDGEFELQGDVIDDDSAGVIRANLLTSFGGRFFGEAEDPLPIKVSGNFNAPRKSSQLNHVSLEVADSVKIGPEVTLMLTEFTNWESGTIFVDSAGYLFSRADTLSTFEFHDQIYLIGDMELRSGIHTFHDSVFLEDSASFQGKNIGAQMYFFKAITNDGEFGSSSIVVLHEDLLGSQPITFSGLVSIAADSTIRNLNTGGLTIQGQLTGENEASTLLNEGSLYLRPFAVATEMMPVGKLDVLSNPDNWVIFASTDKNQLLPGNVYQNLGIENNDKLMGGGDIEVKGDLSIAARVRPVEGTLDVFRFLLTGEKDQTISGSGLGSIENLEIAKASGKVLLGSDVEVSKLLVMSAGVIETGDYTLSLGTGGQLEENRNSYVIGRVITRRSISAGSTRQFGGLGLKIKASGENALGETLVTRITGSAYEEGMIERYFDIQPTNNANLGASVEFTYDERDLIGADEYDLYLEHLVNQDFFVTLDASKIDTVTNVLSQADIDAFGILTAKPTSIAVNAYPSPLRDDEDLNLEYVLQQTGIVHIVVFDRVGRAIYRDRFSGEPGKQKRTLTELNLAPGVYYVRVKAGRQKGYKSFLKLPAN